MCRVGDSEEERQLNLSQGSLTSTETIRKLSTLKTTHPELFKKLTNDDTEPDPITKQRLGSKQKATKSTLSAKPDNNEEQEEIKPLFPHAEYDDSCDVPIEAVAQHIINDGQEIDGVHVNEDGSLERAADVEDPEREVSEDLGRGKRRKRASMWYGKDWKFTRDDEVVREEKKERRGPAKGKGKGKSKGGERAD